VKTSKDKIQTKRYLQPLDNAHFHGSNVLIQASEDISMTWDISAVVFWLSLF
jgi:hypothetical protein